VIALAVDENFDHHILRALLRRAPKLDAREGMPGVIEVQARAAVGVVVEDLLLVVECATADDFRDRVFYVPFG
jgi:hypothetical protein